jgi:hypothetical protein
MMRLQQWWDYKVIHCLFIYCLFIHCSFIIVHSLIACSYIVVCLLFVHHCLFIIFDDPTRIHTLRKYVGQAKDKTSVETVRAKQ